ncbi:MAG: chemotaxis protein CheB [bacterium]
MKAVLIITDIGGPPLLHELLSQLPENFGAPIVVLQSFDVGIFDASTAVFQRTVQLQVEPLAAETTLLPGCVYFARPQEVYDVDGSDGPLIVRQTEPGEASRLGQIVRQFAEICDEELVVLFLSGKGQPQELPEVCQALNDSRAEVLVLDESEAVVAAMGKKVREAIGSARVLMMADMTALLRGRIELLPRSVETRNSPPR